MKQGIMAVLWCCLAVAWLPGQNAGKVEAHRLSLEGLKAMQEGSYPAAIQSFSRARKLDRDNADYDIQLSQAYFFSKDYKHSISLVKPLLNKKGAGPEVYRLYGNNLDMMGKPEAALDAYEKGLKEHPASGELYLEMGILEYGRHRDAEALAYWERGILAAPTFGSNYYWAARVLHERGDLAWAGIYAEVFLNLERMGARVREQSALLMQTYDDARIRNAEGTFVYDFCQEQDSFSGNERAATVFQEQLEMAYAPDVPDTAQVLSIADLQDRRAFACYYMEVNAPDNPGMGMFEWHRKLIRLGIFEAYNYWLLYDARPDEFMAWYETHKDDYTAFESWYLRNSFHKHIRRPLVRPSEQ